MIRKLIGAFLIAVIGFGLLPVVGNVSETPELETESVNGNFTSGGETFDLEHTWEYTEIEDTIDIEIGGDYVVENGDAVSGEWDFGYYESDDVIKLYEMVEGATAEIVLVSSNEIEIILDSTSAVLEEGEEYTMTWEREYEPTTTDQLVGIIPFLYAMIIVGGVVVYVKYAGLND